MEKYIDLHTHSIKSDGSMTPTELVFHAKEKGLSAIALTDHDGVGGVKEAMKAGEKAGIEVVPGIEFSAKCETEEHILGYYIDIDNPVFSSALVKILRARDQRNIETAEKIQKLGFDITIDDAKKYAGGALIGRAHFAKAMVEKGYVESVKAAFDKYFSVGKPCFCKTQLYTSAECVSLINEAGGAAFVAHLHLIKKSDEEIFKFLKELKAAGLCGIEGYYTDYTPKMQETYQQMAKELGLLISGGTDFHAKMKPHISIGVGLGNLKIPYSLLEDIKKWRAVR